MADHTFTKADIEYIYDTVLGKQGKLKKDVPKILAKLPSSFSLEQFQNAAKDLKLSDKSMGIFNDAVSYITDAVAAAPAPTQQETPTTPIPTGATGTPQIPTGGKNPIENYLPGQGPIGNALTNLVLGGGQNAFARQPTWSEGYNQGALASYRPTQASSLENQLAAALAGGPQGLTPRGFLQGGTPQSLTPQASAFEQMLQTMAGNPYLQSIASGQIPQVMQDALNNSLNLSRANTLEANNMGGALAASDFAEGMARAENEARTNFLANMAGRATDTASALAQMAGAGGGLANQRTGLGYNLFGNLAGIDAGLQNAGMNLFGNLLGTGINAEQGRMGQDRSYQLNLLNSLMGPQTASGENALQRQFGLASQLFGGEQAQRGNALNLAYQDYLRGQGLPPELAGLLALAGLGGGTTKTTSTTSGGGGIGMDLLKAAAYGAGAGATGMNFGGGGGGAGGGDLAGIIGGGKMA